MFRHESEYICFRLMLIIIIFNTLKIEFKTKSNPCLIFFYYCEWCRHCLWNFWILKSINSWYLYIYAALVSASRRVFFSKKYMTGWLHKRSLSQKISISHWKNIILTWKKHSTSVFFIIYPYLLKTVLKKHFSKFQYIMCKSHAEII